MESVFSLKEHLRQLEEKLLTSEIRKSSQELTKLLADDFFEFGSSGIVWYKKDCVEGEISAREMTLSDFEINLLSEDVVLATYLVKDETRMQKTLRSSLWKFIDGRWQMLFHQGTITNSY